MACRIFAQKWVPWTFKQGKDVVEWTSSHLSLASVQYGAFLGREGRFPAYVQNTFVHEVHRLEALVAKEAAQKKSGKH